MEALLRFIFILVLVYYGFKLVARYVVPWVISRFIKQQQQKFNDMNGYSNSSNNVDSEGEVHIKTKQPSHKSKNDNDFGEYVDFEDVGD